jgi:hypothetical protein
VYVAKLAASSSSSTSPFVKLCSSCSSAGSRAGRFALCRHKAATTLDTSSASHINIGCTLIRLLRRVFKGCLLPAARWRLLLLLLLCNQLHSRKPSRARLATGTQYPEPDAS